MAGAILHVRVTPRAAKPGIGGWRNDADGRPALEVRVAAAPADGAANDEVERTVARWLGLPGRAVRIAAGGSSRHKRLAIAIAPDELDRLLGERAG